MGNNKNKSYSVTFRVVAEYHGVVKAPSDKSVDQWFDGREFKDEPPEGLDWVSFEECELRDVEECGDDLGPVIHEVSDEG